MGEVARVVVRVAMRVVAMAVVVTAATVAAVMVDMRGAVPVAPREAAAAATEAAVGAVEATPGAVVGKVATVGSVAGQSSSWLHDTRCLGARPSWHQARSCQGS